MPEDDLFTLYRKNQESLPDDIFFYAVSQHQKMQEKQKTISFAELSYGPLSPGRVFRLDEYSLNEKLEKVASKTNEKWVLTETAGIKQIMIKEYIPSTFFLKQYYETNK